jgi:hypothetical protein
MAEEITIQPLTPTPPIRSLNGCPVLIGHALEYLADNIIVRYDIDSYLTLQRAVNVVWAAETRRLMKKSLQQLQASRAILDEGFFVKNLATRNNPKFVAALTLDDLVRFYDWANEHDHWRALAWVISGYVGKVNESSWMSNPTYPIRRGVVVRAAQQSETRMEGDYEYGILRRIERCNENDIVSQYHYGYYRIQRNQNFELETSVLCFDLTGGNLEVQMCTDTGEGTVTIDSF